MAVGMLLDVLCSVFSLIPYLVVYQILLLITKNEVTFGAILMWAGIGVAAAVLQAVLTSFAGICSHMAAFNTMHKIKVKVLGHMSRFNLVLGIAVPMLLMGKYPDMSDELAQDTEKLNASANEFITAMPVIKMYHLTAEKFEQYRNSLALYTACWKQMCVYSCNPLSIALVVLDSAILFTLPFGGWLYLKGSLSAASYLLFIMLIMCFFI